MADIAPATLEWAQGMAEPISVSDVAAIDAFFRIGTSTVEVAACELCQAVCRQDTYGVVCVLWNAARRQGLAWRKLEQRALRAARRTSCRRWHQGAVAAK